MWLITSKIDQSSVQPSLSSTIFDFIIIKIMLMDLSKTVTILFLFWENLTIFLTKINHKKNKNPDIKIKRIKQNPWYHHTHLYPFQFISVVPGAPPRNITATATSATTIAVNWLPPPAERSNGRIIYYKVFFVDVGRSDNEATITTLNKTSIVLDELKRWTEYKIWVLAGTSVGDGPRSHPIIVRTHEDGMYIKY